MTRLEVLERRLAVLEQEVTDLRAQVRGPAAPAQTEHAAAAWGHAFELPDSGVRRRTIRPQAPPPRPTPRPPRPAHPRRELDVSRLFGALGLAVAGGIVTVLGIVFFFVLAANRGWINPELRLVFGAAASTGVFATGVWLRQRFGTTHAALAAVGAGIAGAYATLLAATALYGFVGELGALAGAAGIAAVATVVAVSWKAELVAGLGLVGALLVPLMTVVEEDELTLIGTGFVAVAFAATATVAVREGWRALLIAGILASFPQIAGLVATSGATAWTAVWLAVLFWALYTAVALFLQLPSKDRIDSLTAALTVAAAALAAFSSARLFDGDVGGWSREGLALLVVSAGYLALGAVLLRRLRDYSTLLWALGLTLLAAAGAQLLSGSWLAVAWAAEAAVLSWLGEASQERRLRLASAAYLVLALGYTLGHEAPVSDLLELSPHPAGGVPSVLAVAVSAVLVAWFSRRAAALHAARDMFVWLAGALALYAASLGLLELFAWLADDRAAGFERGHVAVSALWALTALALVEAGGLLRRLDLSVAGIALAAITVLKTAVYDGTQLLSTRWAIGFLLVGAGALLAGAEYQRLWNGRWRRLRPEAACAIAASAILGDVAVVELAGGHWQGIDVLGGSFVLLALPYALLSAAVFRLPGLRGLATLLWAIATTFVGAALFLLVTGVWLVLALALASMLLAVLALAVREARLQLASALYLLTGLAYTLALEAPPRDFVVASEHPGAGALSLVLLALAAVGFGLCARHEAPADPESFSWSETITLAGLLGAIRSWQSSYRLVAFAGAGILLLYALSLGILELAELVSGAGVESDFQRGHTAVSAAWGVIGLCLLTLGLIRRSRGLRLAGFALYGISIAKLFLYDLTYSSPMGRPLSFLVVGILLLASGFFYQRLGERLEERDRGGARTA